MKRLLHKAMASLLATVVLGGSLLPPAVWHAHAADEETHSHSAEAKLDDHDGHHHSHSHKSSGHHHKVSTPGARQESQRLPLPEGFRTASAHLHLSLIGIAASLLVPNEYLPNTPSSPSDNQLLRVMSLLDDMILQPGVQVSGTDDTAAVAPRSRAVAIAISSVTGIGRCAGVHDRVLLCDSARLERCGVLRI